jgi:hypothetical protein
LFHYGTHIWVFKGVWGCITSPCFQFHFYSFTLSPLLMILTILLYVYRSSHWSSWWICQLATWQKQCIINGCINLRRLNKIYTLWLSTIWFELSCNPQTTPNT